MRPALAASAILAALALTASARAQDVVPTVRVHIEGDPRAVLEMHSEAGWTVVCEAPCDRRVPLDVRYRINGDGIQQSKRFELPSTYGEVRVDVAPAPAALHVLGVVWASLGGAAFIGGLQTMIVAVFTESCSDCVGGFANTTAPNVAWALMGAGALSVIGGSVLVAQTRTQVTLTTEDHVSVVAPERRAVVAPPVVGVPVFGFSF